MKFLIIGAEISGLYAAYSLHKKFGITDILIVEKNNRIGGRIETKYLDDGVSIEMGAGGIVNTQANVMALLKELEIDIEFPSGSGGKKFVELSVIDTGDPDIPTTYQIDRIIPVIDTDFYQIINALQERVDREPSFKKMATDYCLYYLIEKYYGPDRAKLMTYQHGYQGDFYFCNAVDSMEMFRTSFSPTAKFSGVPGGMSHIIRNLAAYLEKHNIEIRLNTRCEDIERIDSTYLCHFRHGGEVQADNIIFTLPGKNMIQIKYLRKIHHYLNTVEPKALLRAYLLFPVVNGKVWFDFMESTITTPTLLSQIIPVNKEHGILMIYCDTFNAKTIKGIYKSHHAKKELHFQLQKLFGDIDIPEPLGVIVSYHDSATHVWKPSVSSAEMYNIIRHPIPDENIFIVGETYSFVQEWSEGAVRGVNDLMKLLAKKKLI